MRYLLILAIVACAPDLEDFGNAPPVPWGTFYIKGYGCSAAPIGEYLAVTAAHCVEHIAAFNSDEAIIEFYKQGTRRILFAVVDGTNDAAIVILDERIARWLPTTAEDPLTDEPVYFYSAFSGSHTCRVKAPGLNPRYIEAECSPNAGPGDSGAAVVNEDGEVVAVLTGGSGSHTVMAKTQDIVAQFGEEP